VPFQATGYPKESEQELLNKNNNPVMKESIRKTRSRLARESQLSLPGRIGC